MRIGLMAGATAAAGQGLGDIVRFAQMAEQRGFDSVWLAHIMGPDAINTLSIAGWETTRIELGTAVTPTFPRHPTAMAQQALTAGVACGGRFTLGIGLSHKLVIEDMFGLSYEHPAEHMQEYLSVLTPLLRGEAVDFAGHMYRCKLALDIADRQPVPLVIAALGPKMLRIAGTLADGTTTWMTGPKTLAGHILPAITEAATAAGKPAPRVIAGLPVAVTANAAAARDKIAHSLQIYGMLPSYRAMLDREGAAGPADIALVGDKATVRDGIAQLREAGVTDFNAAIMPIDADAYEQTLELLTEELRQR